MQHCLLFMRILKISCKAAIKSFFKISVHKYYVVGIKTVVVVIVAILRWVFALHAVRNIFSHLSNWNFTIIDIINILTKSEIYIY